MFIFLLIIFGILLELIILVGGVYFSLKYFNKVKSSVPIEVKVSNKNITSEVIRDGVKAALQEIVYEQEQEKIFEKKRRSPEYVYSSAELKEPIIKSNGELIPFNITDNERETLRQFYSSDDNND